MENWKDCLISPEKILIDAVQIIDSTPAKIALVVDQNRILKGTITDYDVRNAILNGKAMDISVTEIFNSNPKFVLEEDSDFTIFQKMKETEIRQMPILNSNCQVVGLKIISEMNPNYYSRKNPVLIMAGGLGSRLRPLTDDCPKPLLKVMGKPILEIILESFISKGFKKFYISVNYKAEMIENYFGDGAKFGVSIEYIKEKKRLGTAGAIGLLPKNIEEPLIVMNGDLLTKVDFHQLLDFHYKRKSVATMCVRQYTYQIPYGVVDFDEWNIINLKEKPSYSVFVNAGIYVLNPEIVYQVKKDCYLDMTDIFSENMKQKRRTLIFLIREYWMDVGRLEDFNRVQEEFFL